VKHFKETLQVEFKADLLFIEIFATDDTSQALQLPVVIIPDGTDES